MKRRAVRDDLSEVSPAVAWVEAEAAAAGLSADVRNALQVCVEEALVNLILHGRAQGEKDIAVGVMAGAAGATVAISDRCAPFDVSREAAPAGPTAADMREGGMGLRLIRSFASELSYASAGGRNTLTMSVRPAGAG